MKGDSFYKRMSSGKYIDMGNFTEEDVDLRDINVSLNHILRFNGHHADVAPLTVAQHSLLCYNMAVIFEPDEYLLHQAVLQHDFAEAYIGDVATPIKRAMGSLWVDFATPIEETVERVFLGAEMGPEMHERVKVYDTAALDIERRVMWHSQYGKDKWPASPLGVGNLEDKHKLFEALPAYVDLAQMWKDNS